MRLVCLCSVSFCLNFLQPQNGVEYCDQHVLYVCLSVSSRISKTMCSDFTKFFTPFAASRRAEYRDECVCVEDICGPDITKLSFLFNVHDTCDCG